MLLGRSQNGVGTRITQGMLPVPRDTHVAQYSHGCRI